MPAARHPIRMAPRPLTREQADASIISFPVAPHMSPKVLAGVDGTADVCGDRRQRRPGMPLRTRAVRVETACLSWRASRPCRRMHRGCPCSQRLSRSGTESTGHATVGRLLLDRTALSDITPGLLRYHHTIMGHQPRIQPGVAFDPCWERRPPQAAGRHGVGAPAVARRVNPSRSPPSSVIGLPTRDCSLMGCLIGARVGSAAPWRIDQTPQTPSMTSSGATCSATSDTSGDVSRPRHSPSSWRSPGRGRRPHHPAR